jgi:hypothetical protein
MTLLIIDDYFISLYFIILTLLIIDAIAIISPCHADIDYDITSHWHWHYAIDDIIVISFRHWHDYSIIIDADTPLIIV